jgi:Ca-activated chloride channel family protein
MLWREPNLLWLLFVVVGFGGVLLVLLRRREARLAVFAEEALARRLTPDLDRRRRVVRILLRAVALLLVVVALAGPKWGFHWEEVKREGIDLIVAIDTSRSMLST